MLLDNEENGKNKLKVYEWIQKYIKEGSFDIVTGYFTVGILAWLSKKTNDSIERYRFILGDIVHTDEQQIKTLDLLNENITIEAALKLNTLAKDAVNFLRQNKLEIKTLEPNFCHAKAYIFKHKDNEPQLNYYISGSSNLTEAGMGLKKTNNVELNTANFGSAAEYKELAEWFDKLWNKPQAHLDKTLRYENGKIYKKPFKEYLIDEIQKIFIEYTPYQLYYKVLFELFGDQLLLDQNNPEFNRQVGRLENTVIYNALYEFQQKGVLSLIKMLQKYNGAILADAVGLGKTWTALAIMKFYQLQGREVILICPKKLKHNWNQHLKNQCSKFEKDQFEYFIRFHTDLQTDRLEQYEDRSDKLFVNEKPKLFVIDESHNLRNDKSQRYKSLVNYILKRNEDVKVLMLSATPINNSLQDIRNQFKLIVKGDKDGFNETLGIKNIDYSFKEAQKAFNEWSNEPWPKIGDFIKKLPDNFFKLTDALTVARTRKMIEGHQNNLFFPKKERPQNIFITPKQIGNFESFEELFEHFPPTLSGYQPAFYVNNYQQVESILDDEKLRDFFLVKMMYILMVKRLESSWFSFKSTVVKILNAHQNILDNIQNYEENKKDEELNPEQLTLLSEDDMEIVREGLTIGKREIKISDISNSGMLKKYKKDLKKDIESLDLLISNLTKFEQKIKEENSHNSNDDKLQELIRIITNKQKSGQNNNNTKVLIFTVYKDTAFYLYEQLIKRGLKKVAVISGDSSKAFDLDYETEEFEPILERFAPYTKLFMGKEWDLKPSSNLSEQDKYNKWKEWIAQNKPETDKKIKNPIDILIATDTLSEGQNLQDCDMVINYDIHWNPVRVIQRVGRIDRLGSPNEKIFGVNFWPSNNINTYLNLQGRIERRMAQMRLAGAEVHPEFSETFKQMAEDESLERKQKERMLRQMEISWDDIEVNESGLSFDNLSLETYRQNLLEELKKAQKVYTEMPNAVYTGFKANPAILREKGIIALLGYPAKAPKSENHKYKSYDLIYINYSGESVLLNQKEVIDALTLHKDEKRYVPQSVDQGEEHTIKELSSALNSWLKKQTENEEIQEDGTIKTYIGDAGLDIINKLQSGDSRQVLANLKTEGNIENLTL